METKLRDLGVCQPTGFHGNLNQNSKRKSAARSIHKETRPMAFEYKRIDVDSHCQEKPDTWTSRMSKAKWAIAYRR